MINDYSAVVIVGFFIQFSSPLAAFAKDVQEFCEAGQAVGMSSSFTDGAAALGSAGKWPANIERDLLRQARKSLGVDFEVYPCPNILRDGNTIARDAEVGMLLPHEICHWLWTLNPSKFEKLFPPARIRRFWSLAISLQEDWFVCHPMYENIMQAADTSMFLPIQVFGDDACLKKTRAIGTILLFAHCGLLQ